MRIRDSRVRLLVLLALLLALGFVGSSVINYQIARKAVHSEIVHNDLPLTMNNIYSDLSAALTRPILVASSMANDTFLQDWVLDGEQDERRVRKYLQEIKEKYNFFSTFFISAYSLRYYHFKGVHKVISPADSHDVWYYRFIAAEKEYDLDVDTDEAGSNVLTVFINYRLEDDHGRLLGVTGVGLRMDHLADLIADYQQRYGRNVFLTDRNGLIQVHRDTSLIETTTLGELVGSPAAAEVLAAASRMPYSFEYEKGGDRIVVSGRYLENLEWLLLVEQNETEALREARMHFWRTVLIGLLTSAVVMAITLTVINGYQRQLERLAVVDSLTGCANRRKLEDEYSSYVSRSDRGGRSFSLVLMDLDGFKAVNDSLGHLHGDQVLRTVANQLAGVVRPSDLLARWGGDEFAILSESGSVQAVQMAERLRRVIAGIDWAKPDSLVEDPRRAVSLSIGIAVFGGEKEFADLLLRADQALYRAKELGGDRVEVAG